MTFPTFNLCLHVLYMHLEVFRVNLRTNHFPSENPAGRFHAKLVPGFSRNLSV